jgi:SAM-dependent methyltransferase
VSFAFDQVAAEYDVEFTHRPLARMLREAVWARLGAHFQAGMQVLELGCGTGEDAVWLAKNGVRVTATDVAQEMLKVARQKAEQAGVANRIETMVLDAAAPRSGVMSARNGSRTHVYDGAYSNFGALNCVQDLRPLARTLVEWIKPGGKLVLVFIHRWCAWEIGWHLLHLKPRAAFRRLRRGGVDAWVGHSTVHVWYPSIGQIRRAFAPGFKIARVIGLGIFLPPSYLEDVVESRPRLFRALARLERKTSTAFLPSRLADHLIIEFERTD